MCGTATLKKIHHCLKPKATSVSAAFSDATEPEKKKTPQTNLLQRYWI